MGSSTLAQHNSPLIQRTVTVASGASVSTASNHNGLALVGIVFPATMTQTVVALEGSDDGTTYTGLFKGIDGTRRAYSVVASGRIDIEPVQIGTNCDYIRIVTGSLSGHTFSAGNEGADRSITLVFRPVS